MKNPMKSTVASYGVYALFTVAKHAVTRMDKGQLRCLRKTTQNTHVCAPLCMCEPQTP